VSNETAPRPPSSVRYAVSVGGWLLALLLLFVFVGLVAQVASTLLAGPAEGLDGSFVLVLLTCLLSVWVGTIALAYGEDRATAWIDGRRAPAGLVFIVAGAALAILVATPNVVWAGFAAVRRRTDPDDETLRILATSATPWAVAALSVLGPAQVALLRASRALRLGWRLCVVLAGVLAVAGVAWHQGDDADGPIAAIVVSAGLYLAAAALARWLHPRPLPEDLEFQPGGSLGVAALYALIGPGLVGWVLMQTMGLPGLAVYALLGGLLAWQLTRELRAGLAGERSLVEEPAPAWFDPSRSASLLEELAARGLRPTGDARLYPGLFEAEVVVLLGGPGATVAMITQPPPTKGDASPEVTLGTRFSDERCVVTTNRRLDGIGWLAHDPASEVFESVPDAPLEVLFARHARDVTALSASSGPAAPPGDPMIGLQRAVESWPKLRARLLAAPAWRVLVGVLWFAPRLPRRLRGPLPR
jgi:hypothetical protein